MSDFKSTPILDESYPPSQAENGKFVKLDTSTIPDYGINGIGKYAVLTYCVNNNSGVVDFPEIAKDSFGRLRTSNPSYRFDSQLTYNISNDSWDTSSTNGTIVHDATQRWAALTVNASGNNSAILQSHYHSPYTPGRSQLSFITFLMGEKPDVGGFKRVGYFDGANGVYLEQTNLLVNLVLKSTTSKGTETVPQSAWNIDTMDGTGPSGLIINFSAVQILVIQLQALYVGKVIIGFDIDGEIIPVHSFLCANNASFPYIAQASLPIRYEVGSTANTSTQTTLKAVCASVISEGGNDLEDITGRSYSVNMGTTPITGITTRRPILTIQAKQQLNSINQNVICMPQSIEVYAKSTDVLVEIVRNGTLTGASFADVDTTSAIQSDVSATSITGGQVIESFYANITGVNRTITEKNISGKAVMCYSHLLGIGDKISIVVTRNANTGGCEAQAALKWKEIR